MTEAAAMDLAVSSGLVGDAYQLVKSGAGKITTWVDRAKGLKLLKNLPKGPLEAFVFGEDDVTPELLAALSLGGTPGLQLSTIALLQIGFLGLECNKHFYQSEEDLNMDSFLSEEGPEVLCEGDEFRLVSFMDGQKHTCTLLDGKYSRTLIDIPLPGDDHLSGLEIRLVVLAFVDTLTDTRGLVVTDLEKCYYCENRFGKLELSDIGQPMTSGRLGTGHGSMVFLVSLRDLEEYSRFQRLCVLSHRADGGIVRLLGLQKVAKELGGEFVTQLAADGTSLLSKQHLRDVHNNLGEKSTLKMPTKEELRTRFEESGPLPVCDRDAGLLLFGTMQELISDFVKNIESEAARPGNVGVRPYKRKWESNLISSSIVQAVGMDATFAIFDDFRSSKLNITVSPGCTAVYFPGLSLTVAFPEGFEVQRRRVVLRPACPFTTDLRESLSILLELAPKLAAKTLTQFAKTLRLELAKDPTLALSPITEAVVRVLSPRGRPCDAMYLTDLFDYLKKHNPESTWGEASVAGILCQLGMTFSLPPRREGCQIGGFRCFFQVCREVWPSTCLGAELVVDCGVDISGCEVWAVRGVTGAPRRKTFYLYHPDVYCYELTGDVDSVPWDRLDEQRECVGFLRGYTLHADDYMPKVVHIPIPCRVIGFGRPREVRPREVRPREACFGRPPPPRMERTRNVLRREIRPEEDMTE